MADVETSLYELQVGDALQKCRAASQIGKELKGHGKDYAKMALHLEVWNALLGQLVDPEQDPAVYESVLLCIAELFTPETQQVAKACQAHLRQAADLLINQPDDCLNAEARTLPAQLSFHLLDTSSRQAPATLAITRTAVALAEHMGASSEDALLASELMLAFMVAMAQPVGGRASGGILCALALFHLMVVSPRLLHTALGKGSNLVPSICALMRHVITTGLGSCTPTDPDPGLAVNARTAPGPSAAKYKVLPSDCVSMLLHVIHLEPWQKHPSIHRDTFSRLVLQRISESRAIACLVHYMELETAGIQEVTFGCAAKTQAKLDLATEQLGLQISEAEHELDACMEVLGHFRMELHRIKHAKAPYHDQPSAGLLQQHQRASQGKAQAKHQVHLLRRTLACLHHRQQLLSQQARAAAPLLRQVMERCRSDAQGPAPPRPNLGVLAQAASTLVQLASPLATANKTYDAEQEQMRESIHKQMLASNFLGVSLNLGKAAGTLVKLVRQLKSLLSELAIAEDTAAELSAAEQLIQSNLKRLGGVRMRLSFKLKQVEEELHRVSKAHMYNFPHGNKLYSVPLTPDNTLCTGIKPKHLQAREFVLLEEHQHLESLLSAITSTHGALERHLGQVQERQAALAALTRPKAGSPSGHHQAGTSGSLGGSDQMRLQQVYSSLLSVLSHQLPPLAFPERAVDHLHDLLLPPYISTAKHLTSLTSSSGDATRGAKASNSAGALGRQQVHHQGSHQAHDFMTRSAATACSFHSSPMHSKPASPRARPASAQDASPQEREGQENCTSAGALGPDLSKPTLVERAVQSLDAVHSTLTSALLLCTISSQGEKDAGAASGSHPPPLSLDTLCQQSSDLEAALAALTTLSSVSRSLTITSRMLPTYCSFDKAKADMLASYLEPLMANYATCIEHQKGNCSRMADSVAEIAKKNLTSPADYVRVYVNTGILDTLISQVCHKGGGNPPKITRAKFHTKWEDQIGHDLSCDFYEKLSPPPPQQQQQQQQQRHAEGNPPRVEVSRYTLVVPTLRPSGPGVARQAASAAALLEIGRSHPEALEAVAGDKEAIPSLCDLALNFSIETGARMSAAALLAATVSAGTKDCAELAVRRGAFTALLVTMDSDHRQGSNGAKGWIIAALIAVGKDEGLRALISDVLHNRAEDDGRGGLRNSLRQSQAAQKLVSVYELQTDEQVQSAILRTLWEVPLQLVALLSSDAAKGGRTIEPSTIEPLHRLGEQAAQALTTLVVEDPCFKRLGKRMAIASHINIVFLQSIKDPNLHEALLRLKAQLS